MSGIPTSSHHGALQQTAICTDPGFSLIVARLAMETTAAVLGQQNVIQKHSEVTQLSGDI